MNKQDTAQSLPMTVSYIDENHMIYGNFIGLQYMFDDLLDPQSLQSAIDNISLECPYLTGRYDRRATQIVGPARDLILRQNPEHSGRLSEYIIPGFEQCNRADFIKEPKRQAVLSGKAPLASFTLTPLSDGGCILGVAISHILVDAAGFHLIAARLAEHYSAIRSGQTPPESSLARKLPIFQFGSGAEKSKALRAIKKAGLPKPVKMRGPLGALLSRIIMQALNRMMDHHRYVAFLTPDQLSRLKQTVLVESGEDWISTNAALCAHFVKIIAALMFENSPKKHVMLGQLLDLRGRYFQEDRDKQIEFTGNAILIDIQTAMFESGLQNTSRGVLAKYFKRRAEMLSIDYLKARLDMTEDSLASGFTYPGLDLKNPIIAVNNQTKMNVYGLRFSNHDLKRVIPQDVGDNIMFFPSPDGGVEIYLRDVVKPSRISALRSAFWQAKIFDIVPTA